MHVCKVYDYLLVILNIVQMGLLANAEVEETVPLTLDLIIKRLRKRNKKMVRYFIILIYDKR